MKALASLFAVAFAAALSPLASGASAPTDDEIKALAEEAVPIHMYWLPANALRTEEFLNVRVYRSPVEEGEVFVVCGTATNAYFPVDSRFIVQEMVGVAGLGRGLTVMNAWVEDPTGKPVITFAGPVRNWNACETLKAVRGGTLH
ncbi:hypothetical protein [Burkholderia sp. ABCPW 14]|uniref:hypothetical protein n=1 Tax=Burkholderia sp. ABCPW 14 TaxID=1637860 RepID=UPI000ADE96C3|nr:hypothetical protein [Burkholderia sp. ABCPW 14]